MSQLYEIEQRRPDLQCRGLAPVSGYEPWLPRCIEAIKQSINDGEPVMIRLHSAAEYGAVGYDGYAMDLESHAVLIVGYDDERQAFSLLDPWNPSWGGAHGGRRWLSYTDFKLTMVNSSSGSGSTGTSPRMEIAEYKDDNGNLSLIVRVGFYEPHMYIMDRDNIEITKVAIFCHRPAEWGGGLVERARSGHWTIGEMVDLSLPLGVDIASPGEVRVEARLSVQGQRPYHFADEITATRLYAANAAPSVVSGPRLQNCAGLRG